MKTLAPVLLVLLAGCAHRMMTPVPIGPDTYMLTTKSNAGIFKNGSEVKLELYERAGAWCASRGQQMEEINSTATNARPGLLPTAELHFKCVASG